MSGGGCACHQPRGAGQWPPGLTGGRVDPGRAEWPALPQAVVSGAGGQRGSPAGWPLGEWGLGPAGGPERLPATHGSVKVEERRARPCRAGEAPRGAGRGGHGTVHKPRQLDFGAQGL